MASRTRVPTKHIDEIVDAIDVSDRWARLLGKIDLQRYLGIDCGLANPIHTQTVFGGAVVDPRARTWVLNQLTDSVQVAPILGAVWDVSDRWARQLGQIDIARVLGAVLTPANPVISGIYDALGNRMPSMDAVARAGYVDVIDRAARLLGIGYGDVGQLAQRAVSRDLYVQLRTAGAEYDARDVSDRWARQLGLFDLSRVLGAGLSAANPVIAGIYDNAGNRMPTMDAYARRGNVEATSATRTSFMNQPEREDLISYGSLFSPNANGALVVGGTAGQKIKVFDVSYEVVVAGLHYMYFGVNNAGATTRFANRQTIGVFAQTYSHPHESANGDDLYIYSAVNDPNIPVSVHYIKE